MTTIQSTEHRFIYAPISKVKTITQDVVDKLTAKNMKYMQQIFLSCQTRSQRYELAQQLAVPMEELDMLACYADLMRLRGVGADMAALLYTADIHTCRDLPTCQPEELYRQLARLHIGRGIAYHAPTLAQIRAWVNEAEILATTSIEIE